MKQKLRSIEEVEAEINSKSDEWCPIQEYINSTPAERVHTCIVEANNDEFICRLAKVGYNFNNIYNPERIYHSYNSAVDTYKMDPSEKLSLEEITKLVEASPRLYPED